jgi:hypothetical protein
MIRKVVIYCSGTVGEYLHRWKLPLGPWASLYVHRFIEPDIPVYHDHPWNFFSLILRGGYTEHRPGMPDAVRRPGSIAFRSAETLHYVDNLRGDTWTLVLRLRARREWGFMTTDGWVEWREYVQVKRPRNTSEEAIHA